MGANGFTGVFWAASPASVDLRLAPACDLGVRGQRASGRSRDRVPRARLACSPPGPEACYRFVIGLRHPGKALPRLAIPCTIPALGLEAAGCICRYDDSGLCPLSWGRLAPGAGLPAGLSAGRRNDQRRPVLLAGCGAPPSELAVHARLGIRRLWGRTPAWARLLERPQPRV